MPIEKSFLVEKLAYIYVKEIGIGHGVLFFLIYNRYTRFMFGEVSRIVVVQYNFTPIK